MGIYLNPGAAGFKMSLNSEIFVDKSELLDVTNRYVCKFCSNGTPILKSAVHSF